MIGLAELEAAAARVYAAMPPTPQYAWPLLARRCGREVWVKHENHTPTGASKIRGGLNLVAQLLRARRSSPASSPRRGAIMAKHRPRREAAWCRLHDRRPSRQLVRQERGDARFWRDLLEFGRDFDEAREHAGMLAGERGLHFVGPFDRELVAGVGTYALELCAPFRNLSPSTSRSDAARASAG